MTWVLDRGTTRPEYQKVKRLAELAQSRELTDQSEPNLSSNSVRFGSSSGESRRFGFENCGVREKRHHSLDALDHEDSHRGES